MIPISQDEKIPYDETATGMRFYFKPLTGANEQSYNAIIRKYEPGMSEDKQNAVLDEMIDFILVGWDGPGSKFPEDGHPSKYFMNKFKNELFGKYLALNNLSEEEIKNS